VPSSEQSHFHCPRSLFSRESRIHAS
jgi:hypothetical protein